MILRLFLAVDGEEIHFLFTDAFALEIFTHSAIDVFNLGIALLHVVVEHAVGEPPDNEVGGEIALCHTDDGHGLGMATSLVKIMTTNPHSTDDGCTEDEGDDDFSTFHISYCRHNEKLKVEN